MPSAGMQVLSERIGIQTGGSTALLDRTRFPAPPNVKKILIAHSDALVRRLLSARLEEAQLSVASAASGVEARRIIAEAVPDLVVVDYFLPESEGPALLQFLQRGAQAGPVPSVVFSNPLTRLGEIAQSAGATYVLEESPSNPAAMVEALAACMGPGLSQSQLEDLTRWPSELAKAAVEGTQRDAAALLANARNALLPLARGNRTLRTLYALACTIRPISCRAAFAGLRGVYHIASTLESLAFDCHENPATLTETTLRTFGQTLDLLAALLAPRNILAARDAHPVSILCVEDEPEIRSLIRESLAPVDMNVASASNSLEAIAFLDQKRTDVILLDVGLPDQNGFELCARIRNLLFHEKTPIVFLTGRTGLLNKAQARLSGGDDFMPKPFRPMELALKALYWIYHPRIQSITTDIAAENS